MVLLVRNLHSARCGVAPSGAGYHDERGSVHWSRTIEFGVGPAGGRQVKSPAHRLPSKGVVEIGRSCEAKWPMRPLSQASGFRLADDLELSHSAIEARSKPPQIHRRHPKTSLLIRAREVWLDLTTSP